jgi:hypothetical protein
MNKNITGRRIKCIHDEKMPDPKMINHEKKPGKVLSPGHSIKNPSLS